jgi:hypothetical protein
LLGSHGIPFASTDYDEQGCDKARQVISARLKETCVFRKGLSSVKKVFFNFSDITPNLFHMPGQMQVGSLKLPSLCNGFVTSILRVEGDSPPE